MRVRPVKSPTSVLLLALMSVLLERGDRSPPPRAFRVPPDISRARLDSHPNQDAQHVLTSGRQLEVLCVSLSHVQQEPTTLLAEPRWPVRVVLVGNICHFLARPLLKNALAHVPLAPTRRRQV